MLKPIVRLAAVAVTVAALASPAGAQDKGALVAIRAGRLVVLPGLIDCHTHLVGDAASSDVLVPLEQP